jgi:(4-O-methyl)-D-glucuronate---lignin esterase
MPRAIFAALVCSLALPAFAQEPKKAVPASRQLRPQQVIQQETQRDHKLMMEALGIKSLRQGANGNNRNAPNAANYDESKVKAFTLPDPLVCKDGTKVTSPDQWWSKRRPEIVEDFDREVYGRVPKDVPKVTWEVTSTTREKIGDRPAITKRLLGHVDNAQYPAIKVDIQLTLTTPAEAKGPVPVMMEFGFGFRPGRPPGKAATKKAGDAPQVKATPKARPFGGFGGGPSWQQQVLAKGWGYAIIVPNSIQADNGAGLTRGIIGLCNKGQPRKPEDWGSLRAWAWGASRAIDYFETDNAVDAKQVGIEGLSRYGKAALVAMAYDQRFAIGFIGSSGEGGAKLHRRNFGELVENLTGSGEYHWMAGNFIKYGGPLTPDDLPVDAHELIAMCAPRPTFISYGAASGPGGYGMPPEGQWVDQRGSFQAAVAAGSVFRLLGKKDLGTSEFPEVEMGLTEGELAFRQHKGGHSTGPNWPTFLAFADRYIQLKKSPETSGR